MNKRRIPHEVIGLDLGSSGVKAVRLRQGKEGIALLTAEVLPPPAPEATSLALPPRLLTNYAAVALTSPQHQVRLVTVPGVGAAEEALAPKLQEMIKVEPTQRLAFRTLRTVPAKRETLVLTVAMPEAEVQRVLRLLAHGSPAALSVEDAGLAALTAFYHGPGSELYEEAVCFIEAGAHTTFVTFINKQVPVLIRSMEVGGAKLLDSLQVQWGFDSATSLEMLDSGATIDISPLLHEMVAPFLRQLSISRDFVERQEGCRISRIYLSGGMSQIKQWVHEIQAAMGIAPVVWDPFAALHASALPPAVQGQRSRFAAAIGAALALFKDA